jgi:hypothetical protein
MIRPTLLLVAALIYVFFFGVLFGSSNGIMGDFFYVIDLTIKTKFINSFAIFGFVCVGIGVWAALDRRRATALIQVMIFALWISLSYGFIATDCVIFNFCGESSATKSADCHTEYDGKGAHHVCK